MTATLGELLLPAAPTAAAGYDSSAAKGGSGTDITTVATDYSSTGSSGPSY